MNWFKSSGPYIVIIISAFWITIFSIIDTILDKDWTNYILASLTLLLILSIILLVMSYLKTFNLPVNYEEFQKTLKGGLYHYKCPECKGYFAIKKSKKNNNKIVKMNCPDCGKIGFIIPRSEKFVEEEIPEKKSIGLNYRCLQCGEGITIWAEGSDLHPKIKVFTCPFCGSDKNLKQI